MTEQAKGFGVDIHREEKVVSIDRAKKQVETERGHTFKYTQMILASGPWTNKLLELASLPKLPIFVSNEQSIFMHAPEGNIDLYSCHDREYDYSEGEKQWPCPLVGSFMTFSDKKN